LSAASPSPSDTPTGEQNTKRLLAKTNAGCRFFVTQAVYDITATKSLLSDYGLAAQRDQQKPVPIILTLSPCGSEKTLRFMQWLGIASRAGWKTSCATRRIRSRPHSDSAKRIFADAWEYARDKGIPLGVNVESVSARKAEIDASIELARQVRVIMHR
jgi:hypothetical protein